MKKAIQISMEDNQCCNQITISTLDDDTENINIRVREIGSNSEDRSIYFDKDGLDEFIKTLQFVRSQL
jgi:hypothetical protein